MSFKLSFERLALYSQWMNAGIYEATEKLSADEQNKDRGAFFGSIIGILNHLLVGDTFWFKRFAEHQASFESLEYFRSMAKPNSLSAIVHADLMTLREKRERMDENIILFTSELTDDVISSTLSYKNSTGEEFNKNFGHLLQHVFNHQTHHRGQVSTLLYQAGVDIGVTDMLAGIPND